jgi:predicted Zn-dependent protease
MRRQPDSALGHFLLGSLDIRLGRFAEAESALRQTIQLDPAMTEARLQLVNLLMKEGRKADAVAQLHDFVSAFPGSPYRSQATQLLQQLETSSGSAPVQ